jgi:hypothetical protein
MLPRLHLQIVQTPLRKIFATVTVGVVGLVVLARSNALPILLSASFMTWPLSLNASETLFK